MEVRLSCVIFTLMISLLSAAKEKINSKTFSPLSELVFPDCRTAVMLN